MIVLLDTTALIDVIRGRSWVQFDQLVAGNHTLATSPINIGELYAGLWAAEEDRASALLADVECFPVTATIGRRAGMLKYSWARQGRTISLPDVLVAATALEHGLSLMTNNRKDFPMPDLIFYPPD